MVHDPSVEWSPTFLPPGAVSLKTIFPGTEGVGDGLGMIQVHYIYSALYFHYYFCVFLSYCVIILFYYISSTSDHGVALIVKKRVWNAVLGCNLKNDRMISLRFQGKPFNIMVIQVYAPTSNAEEAEVEQLHKYLQDLIERKPPKRCPFHYRGLEYKSRKSSNTWRNKEIWPWSTEWSRAKANRALPRERTGQSKYPLPTTQEKTLHKDITR